MVSEIQYIPMQLTNLLDKNKYPNIIEYSHNLRKLLVRSSTDYEMLKKDKRFNVLEGNLFEEMLFMEDEKFKMIRGKKNIFENTQAIADSYNRLIKNERVLGETCGLPASGKSTFISKYFSHIKINYDYEWCEFYNLHSSDYDNCDEIKNNFEMRSKLIRDRFEDSITERFKKNSILIDGAYNTTAMRLENIKRIKEYESKVICFVFDADIKKCYERMENRRIEFNNESKNKDSVEQVYHLSSLVYFLLNYKSPINNDLCVENGIDLALAVNIDGEITSAYPKEKYVAFMLNCK